ncbi:hypothetical protein K1X13_05770 [Nocardioides sp. WL0053]|jgi:hypothetical protein|uniref:Uncharacterized protein n=1 Tax=Nocardioides jiangsuensis TaxID=2866161 RepID=A0ABS7RH13_9ACTN|nr:hypothetical protein [Nocardioides jiangsuensis]MBY9074325.1 hypothetical protein [Nocardioides jiangsuensis]
MKKTRFAARIIAGALASAVILTGSLAGPAQAKNDTGWPTGAKSGDTSVLKDTGWPTG